MPPTPRTPPRKWVEEGLRALAAGGPDALRVEALARALGVTKGSFYNHFPDRPALLDQMLDTWEELGVDRPIEHVEAGGGDAKTRLRRLFEVASSTGQPYQVELALRGMAKSDPAVAKRLRRVDNRRMEYLRTLFGEFCPDPHEVEVRCMLVFSLFLGSSAIAAESRDLSRAEVVHLAQERLLEN